MMHPQLLASLGLGVKNTFLNFELPTSCGRRNARAKSAPPQLRYTEVQGERLSANDGATMDPEFFTVVLWRADDSKLGLELAHVDGNRALTVVAVAPGSVVDSWNRHGLDIVRKIMIGDTIVQINDANDAESMIHECSAEQLLVVKLHMDQRATRAEGPNSSTTHDLDTQLDVRLHPNFCPQTAAAAWYPCWTSLPVNEYCFDTMAWDFSGAASTVCGIHSGIAADDASTVSDWTGSVETGSLDEAEAEDDCVLVAMRRTVEWSEDGRKLLSKKLRLTKVHASEIGRFVFTMCPAKTSELRGGASFSASEGRGTLEVKCLSEDPRTAGLLTHITIGSRSPLRVDHEFLKNGLICRVPGVWDFREFLCGGSLRLIFEFERSCH